MYIVPELLKNRYKHFLLQEKPMKKNTIFKYCASLALGLTLCSEISASWTDQIIAGQLGQSGYSGDGGQATSAKLAQPHAVAFDSIGDSLGTVNKLNKKG